MRSKSLSKSQFEDSQQILRDIESLDGYTAFLFDKINFLMDAKVGLFVVAWWTFLLLRFFEKRKLRKK